MNQRWINPCIAAALGCLTLALYFQTRNFEFIGYDDPAYVAGNWHVQNGLTLEDIRYAFTDASSGNWYPLTSLSHQAIATIFGMRPSAFHLLSATLHSASIAILFLVLLSATGLRWRAAAVAALWGWHPYRVESVAWVGELKDVLCGFFFLLCILAYAHYRRRPNPSRYILVMALLICALSSKSMAVTLPIVLLLLDYWPLGPGSGPNENRSWRRWVPRLLEKIPLVLLTLAAALGVMWTQQHNSGTRSLQEFPIPIRLTNALVACSTYLAKTLLPVRLGLFYPHPVMIGQKIAPASWISAGAILLVITIAVLLVRKRQPYLAVGWFWFLIMLLPVIGIMQIGEQSMADRYTYLPTIGLFIMIVWAGADLLPRLIGPALVVAACAALAAATSTQLGYWHDTIRVFRHSDAVIPDNYLARSVLAYNLREKDQLDEALKLGESAVQLSPRSASAHHSWAMALQRSGDLKQALRQYKIAATLDPTSAAIRNDMGGLLVEEGRTNDAIDQFTEAIHFGPYVADSRHNLAVLLAAQGKYDQAIAQWQQALRISPSNGLYHGWMAEAMRLHGDRSGAVEQYRAAIALGEKKPSWEMNLCWLVGSDPSATALQASDLITIARDAVEQTGKTDPLALDALAAVLARAGQFDDAVATSKLAQEQALANNKPELAKLIQSRMMSYQAGRPFNRPD